MAKTLSKTFEAAATSGITFTGTPGTDFSRGSDGDDILNGLGGDDFLSSRDGNDTLDGGDGNDELDGGRNNDHLSGGSGNDFLDGGYGHDILDGGAGNDTLWGGDGRDVYLIGLESGSDLISDSGGSDRVLLGAGISTSDVTLSRMGSSLFLTINGTGQTLLVFHHFLNDQAIQFIEFADGTTWGMDKIDELVMRPATEGDDDLYGSHSDNVIDGLGGNDEIWGFSGDDMLFGGAGDDVLYGARDNDMLSGGAGDDNLVGGGGNDIYMFGLGSGDDSIYDVAGSEGNDADRILLGAGITTSDVTLSNDGINLTLSLNASGETLALRFHFYAPHHSIEFIEFADGTVWDEATIFEMSQNGTGRRDVIHGGAARDVIDGLGGNDELYGHGGGDTLSGGDGNDILFGAIGRDRLDGGEGDDLLYGGDGNDTYLFGLGSGMDEVREYEGANRIQLGAGITSADVSVSASGSTLILTLNDTGEKLSVPGHFQYGDRFIESIEFADGTVWDSEALAAMTMQGTSETDYLFGADTDDELSGFGGRDYIISFGGNDTLDGGAGRDYLTGGAGNDTYLFGFDAGSDWITDTEGVDRILLGDGITTSNVALSRNESGLRVILTLTDTGKRITMDDQAIESVEFADGTIWNSTTMPDWF